MEETNFMDCARDVNPPAIFTLADELQESFRMIEGTRQGKSVVGREYTKRCTQDSRAGTSCGRRRGTKMAPAFGTCFKFGSVLSLVGVLKKRGAGEGGHQDKKPGTTGIGW